MDTSDGSVDLYSLLKVARDATEDEIHRAYKSLSNTFHPDKLPATTGPEKREQIQKIFLEFKRASTYRLLYKSLLHRSINSYSFRFQMIY